MIILNQKTGIIIGYFVSFRKKEIFSHLLKYLTAFPFALRSYH